MAYYATALYLIEQNRYQTQKNRRVEDESKTFSEEDMRKM
jgi:hypothetical protein